MAVGSHCAALEMVEGSRSMIGTAGSAGRVLTASAPAWLHPLPCLQARATPSPLPWLASWAGSLAALGLALPPASQAQLLACGQQRRAELRPVDRQQLRRAFSAWRHQAGLAWLEGAEACALADDALVATTMDHGP